MKNKFLLIILIFLLGIFRVSYAAQFYYFDDYPQKCAQCETQSLLGIALVPPPIVVTAQIDPAVLENYRKQAEEAGVPFNPPKPVAQSDAITITTPMGKDYVVSGTAVSTLINSGKTVLFTELYNEELDRTALYSIAFDASKINLYYEWEDIQEIEKIRMPKYRIVPAELNNNTDNTSSDVTHYATNGSHGFFVCKDCSKCQDSLDNCNSVVASNGFSIPPKAGFAKDTEKLVVSKYCEKHTCAFFWNVNNGNFNIDTVEGLDCRNETMYGSWFCEKHTCDAVNCNKPVIGWNVTDGRSSEPLIYQGMDENQYSNYCVDHFCKHYKCKNQRRSVTSGSAEFSEGRYIYFPGYCTIHGMDCTIKDCENPVINTHYDEENKIAVYICEEHTAQYEELKKSDVESGETEQPTGYEELYKVPEKYIERDTCANCQKYLPRRIENSDIEYGGVSNGKWYCNICFAQQLFIKREVNDYGDGEEFRYNYPEPPNYVDPATCEHFKYPVPTSVRFINVTKEEHTQVWVCTNCNTEQRETYEHIYIDGTCVCGHRQDGYNEDGRIVTIENAEYVMTYSKEEVYGGTRTKEIALVQLRDSNSIQLKIWSDELSVLSYEWEGKLKGYPTSNKNPIPSKEVLKISGDGSKVTDYVLEEPDYILQLEYVTKTNTKPVIIEYQIYLP